jgi:hypothetical protein
MRDEDALVADMHRLLGFLEVAPPVADPDTVERLLAGRLDPSDVPPGYGGVARLLAAATAPAAPEELAGERLLLAEFKAVARSHPPTLAPRRETMPSKLASVKVAAAVLAAVLSIGGVAAAATGLLPGQAEQAAERAPSTTGAGAAGRGQVGEAAAAGLDAAAKQGLCQAWQAGQGADHGRRTDAAALRELAVAAGGADNVAAYCKDVTAAGGREAATGPDAGSAAKAGLCRAWRTGQGDHGRRMDSVAFQALAAAAGGADKIAAYCKDAAPGSADAQGPGSSSPPRRSAPSTTVSPPSGGPPADPGSGGQGGPPTTGQ